MTIILVSTILCATIGSAIGKYIGCITYPFLIHLNHVFKIKHYRKNAISQCVSGKIYKITPLGIQSLIKFPYCLYVTPENKYYKFYGFLKPFPLPSYSTNSDENLHKHNLHFKDSHTFPREFEISSYDISNEIINFTTFKNKSICYLNTDVTQITKPTLLMYGFYSIGGAGIGFICGKILGGLAGATLGIIMYSLSH